MEIRVIGTPAEVAELKDELRFAPWLVLGGEREYPVRDNANRVRVYLHTEPKPVTMVTENDRLDKSKGERRLDVVG